MSIDAAELTKMPSDQIEESCTRSWVKTLTSGTAGAILFGLVAVFVTRNHRQSINFLKLGFIEGAAKTYGYYKYERWIARQQIGRNTNADPDANPAKDHPARTMFKNVGWFMLSSGVDALLALAVTHDKGRTENFMLYRGAGRLALSYVLDRLWAHSSWGVTRISNAACAQPSRPPSSFPVAAPEPQETFELA
jgi:hypothetical protein